MAAQMFAGTIVIKIASPNRAKTKNENVTNI